MTLHPGCVEGKWVQCFAKTTNSRNSSPLPGIRLCQKITGIFSQLPGMSSVRGSSHGIKLRLFFSFLCTVWVHSSLIVVWAGKLVASVVSYTLWEDGQHGTCGRVWASLATNTLAHLSLFGIMHSFIPLMGTVSWPFCALVHTPTILK